MCDCFDDISCCEGLGNKICMIVFCVGTGCFSICRKKKDVAPAPEADEEEVVDPTGDNPVMQQPGAPRVYVYGAVEKAVRSVLLMQTQQTMALSDTSDLHALATATQDRDIIRTSLHVQTVTGSSERMLRPDLLSFPKVPRDVYSQSNADTMLELTESLLDYTRDLYLAKL
ncbi:hypothetical protein LSAT2_010379 [Lamellibrachia satsuma]|nr:hypothetical protein LSAT2_010379 [Lamellibrachia satsuma]